MEYYSLKRMRKCARRPCGSVSCFNSAWREQPREPLAPASNYPPTFFPVATSGVSHSAVHAHQDQPPFFNALLPTNHELPDPSELFYRGGGRRQPPGEHATAGRLHLPLSGLLFRPLEGVGHFFRELAKENARARSVSWNCKTSVAAAPSSWTCR